VIPAGTAEKMANNQFVADILPEFVSLRVGDSIVVENLDSATHTFGPITVRANETTSLDFINPGIYFGLCTVGQHDSITIQVT
jgi:plastocyanin